MATFLEDIIYIGVISVKLIKKSIYLMLFLIITVLIGCNAINTNNNLRDLKPADLDFVFNYGVGAKNQLNTTNGKFTKDMIREESITTDLKLSDEEMGEIYAGMNRINILSYPSNFKPKSNMSRFPHSTYIIKIIADGKEKTIEWKDENASESKEAVQLRELFKRIQEIIVNKEEFKKLPEAKGGYL